MLTAVASWAQEDLAKPGPWLVGALVQNVWSYAGDDDAPDVNFFTFQYFITTISKGTGI